MINDKEKDEFIKEAFSKDTLISKKADELFNSYIDGGKKMDKNNVVNISEAKEKDHKEFEKKVGKKKKVLASVAALAILFLGVNGYAYTKGYNNIFFIIRNLVKPDESVTYGKDDILTDKDLTISYEPIVVADGVTIQINKLMVSNGKAWIEMKANIEPDSEGFEGIIVKDFTNGEGKKIADREYVHEGETEYVPINVDLYDYNDSMRILKMQIMRDTKAIAELKINLDERVIDVLSSEKSDGMEKISEIELKQFLSDVVLVNYWRDYDLVSTRAENKEAVNEGILEVMSGIVYNALVATDGNNADNIKMNSKNVKTFYKEMTGIDLDDAESLVSDYSVFTYDKSSDSFDSMPGDWGITPKVINIDDLEYSKGIYDVTFTYCYIYDGLEDEIDSLPVFKTTMRLKLNKDYKYLKFQIDDIYDIGSEKVKEGKQNTSVNNNQTNTNSNTNNTNTTTSISNGNHEHKWYVVKRSGNEDFHTTLDATHTVRCSECGETKTEPHNFGSWYTLYDSNAWTLWCTDCQRYIYTTDYEFVKKSGYEYEDIDQYVNATDVQDKLRTFYEIENNIHYDLNLTFHDILGFSTNDAILSNPKIEKDNLGNPFVETNIKYSDFKNKILNYASERLFTERFSGITKNVDGKLYVMHSFGYSTPYTQSVVQTRKTASNEYHTTILTISQPSGDCTGQFDMDFYTTVENGKEVLDRLEDSVG